MTQNTSVYAGGFRHRIPLTFAATLFLSTFAVAQRSLQAPGGAPSSGPSMKVDSKPRNKLIFPYGIQSFDTLDNLRIGETITAIPGWQVDGPVAAYIAQPPVPRPIAQAEHFVCVEDNGGGGLTGFRTPPIVSPDPWDYSWSFQMQLQSAPVEGSSMPTLAIQHIVGNTYEDVWGIELGTTGATLFLRTPWGVPDSALLFPYTDSTAVGTWINVRVIASLEHNALEGYVNGVKVARLAMNPKATTDVTSQRLAYHGQSAAAPTTLMLDEIGVAFGSGVCKDDLNVPFTTDDFGTGLVDGQDINSPDEFGYKMAISSGGANSGAAIFDSSTGGPNDPSQDPDLLVNQGNILILQTDASTTQTVSGIFDNPNDDEGGGTITFAFNNPLQPLSIDLIDVDAAGNEGITVTLTDFAARTRTYTVPADWTGDLTLAQPGVGTLDLTSIAPQAGFNSVATGAEDANFNPNAVVSIVFELGGSGGLDNFLAAIPCVELTFENNDDGDPDNAGTALVDGQDITSPPEFGNVVNIASFGPNLGAALFDSTPGGPNDPGPDRDLLVGTGNIMILQNTTAGTQTVVGIYDTPNDDQDGGSITFDFPSGVAPHYIDLIDFDEEDVDGIEIVLTDGSGNTRTYDVPGGFTEDLLNDGPPALRRLDLTTLVSQPGFLSPATATEDPGFDELDVELISCNFGGPGAIDNLCFCPCNCE